MTERVAKGKKKFCVSGFSEDLFLYILMFAVPFQTSVLRLTLLLGLVRLFLSPRILILENDCMLVLFTRLLLFSYGITIIRRRPT
jgi:hypothetical protein